mmetsp:Transcript_29729/g.61355  ORF Transcript_29729/g.61355 Transcript_29729/m.61355 type:complete len:164 (+) Transcript_29729:95-586(+)
MDQAAPPLPDGYVLREMCKSDYRKGLVPLLEQLTQVDDLNERRFLEVFDMRVRQADVYRCMVIEHLESQELAATATLLVEAKFIHGGAKVGHIEDVVVDTGHRGKGLARCLMHALAEEASRLKCYKVILDCKEHNVALYEKFGYRSCDVHMRLDLPEVPKEPT